VELTWRQSGKDVDDPKKVPCSVWISSAGIPQVEGQVPSIPYEWHLHSEHACVQRVMTVMTRVRKRREEEEGVTRGAGRVKKLKRGGRRW
jgi:hypothetical protein